MSERAIHRPQLWSDRIGCIPEYAALIDGFAEHGTYRGDIQPPISLAERATLHIAQSIRLQKLPVIQKFEHKKPEHLAIRAMHQAERAQPNATALLTPFESPIGRRILELMSITQENSTLTIVSPNEPLEAEMLLKYGVELGGIRLENELGKGVAINDASLWVASPEPTIEAGAQLAYALSALASTQD